MPDRTPRRPVASPRRRRPVLTASVGVTAALLAGCEPAESEESKIDAAVQQMTRATLVSTGEGEVSLSEFESIDQLAARREGLEAARAKITDADLPAGVAQPLLTRIAMTEAFTLGTGPRGAFDDVLAESINLTRRLSAFETAFGVVHASDPMTEDALAVYESSEAEQQAELQAVTQRVEELTAEREGHRSDSQRIETQVNALTAQAAEIQDQLLTADGRMAFQLGKQAYELSGQAETLRFAQRESEELAARITSELNLLQETSQTRADAVSALQASRDNTSIAGDQASEDQSRARDQMVALGNDVAEQVNTLLATYRDQVADPVDKAIEVLDDVSSGDAAPATLLEMELVASRLELLAAQAATLRQVNLGLQEVVRVAEASPTTDTPSLRRLNGWKRDALSQAAGTANAALTEYVGVLGDTQDELESLTAALRDAAAPLRDGDDPESLAAARYHDLAVVYQRELTGEAMPEPAPVPEPSGNGGAPDAGAPSDPIDAGGAPDPSGGTFGGPPADGDPLK